MKLFFEEVNGFDIQRAFQVLDVVYSGAGGVICSFTNVCRFVGFSK